MRNLPVYHLAEHIQHDHAVIGMGGPACGHSTRKIAGGYRIDGRTADTRLGVGVFGIQATRAHEAVFATCAFGPNGTGLHVARAVEQRFMSIIFQLFQHLQSGRTCGHLAQIQFLCFLFF
jgi:hypothetical protein